MRGAVVGFADGNVFWAPFTVMDERYAQHVCESVDPLRFLDEAVCGGVAEERFQRCCSLNVRRLCHAVWCAMHAELQDERVAAHLRGVVDRSAPLPPLRTLQPFVHDKPRGVWFAVQSLTRGTPTQISKSSHERSLVRAATAVRTVLEPRLGASVRSFASSVADDFSAYLTAPETGGAHVSAALHLFNVNELLSFWQNELKHGDYAASEKQWTQLSDAFLALLHACLTTDYDYSASAAKFTYEPMAEDYKDFRPAVLALWHGLLSACAFSEELCESVRALYDLQRAAMKDWFKNRVRTKFNAEVQTLVLTGVMAHAARAWQPEFAKVTDKPCFVPLLPFLRGVSTGARLPCLDEFLAGVEKAILASQTDMSYRAAVTEVQLCLPSMLLSRGSCCFSNRVVSLIS